MATDLEAVAKLLEREAGLHHGYPMADTYRGWDITPPRWPVPWIAVAPDYDASWEGEEDGWVSSGGIVNAASREALLAEIDTYIEEQS